MTTTDALQKIQSILASEFKVPSQLVTKEANLRSQLGLDSLALTDFVFHLQSEFGLEGELDAFRDLTTVGALAEFLSQHAK